MRTTWPLVGRDDELQFVDLALAGQDGAGVVLVGPPGVGKTRLAMEAAERARSNGLATASVIATVANSEIPFGAMALLEAIASIPEGDLNGSACGCQSVLAEAAAVAGDPSAEKALASMDSARHPPVLVWCPARPEAVLVRRLSSVTE